MQELCELFTLPSYEADIFSLRFSPAGTYLAIGLGDGTVSIVSGKTGKPLALVPASTAGLGKDASAAPSTMGLPITALRWRPEAGTQFRVSEATTAKDVLLAAGSDGVIRHIHANSGRVLSTIVEEGAQIYACDYRAWAAAARVQDAPACVTLPPARSPLASPSPPRSTPPHPTPPQAATRSALPQWAAPRACACTTRAPVQ